MADVGEFISGECAACSKPTFTVIQRKTLSHPRSWWCCSDECAQQLMGAIKAEEELREIMKPPPVRRNAVPGVRIAPQPQPPGIVDSSGRIFRPHGPPPISGRTEFVAPDEVEEFKRSQRRGMDDEQYRKFLKDMMKL